MGADDKVLFGIAAPQIHTRLPVDPREIQSYIERAETSGFHSIWVQELSREISGRLPRALCCPKPVQKPHPPIWFGAHAPAALKRAVKHGSGFIGAGSSSIPDFKSQVQIILSALDEEKKNPAGFTIGKRVYLAVEQGPRARRQTTPGVVRFVLRQKRTCGPRSHLGQPGGMQCATERDHLQQEPAFSF